MSTELTNNSDYIATYSRSDAITDGIIVDLMQPSLVHLVKQAGFCYSLAMTKTAFSRYVELDLLTETYSQDLMGRLWDILSMLAFAIRANKKESEIYFLFTCLPNRYEDEDDDYFLEVNAEKDFPPAFKLCQLKAVCGAGDNGEPSITIMLPDED